MYLVIEIKDHLHSDVLLGIVIYQRVAEDWILEEQETHTQARRWPGRFVTQFVTLSSRASGIPR